MKRYELRYEEYGEHGVFAGIYWELEAWQYEATETHVAEYGRVFVQTVWVQQNVQQEI